MCNKLQRGTCGAVIGTLLNQVQTVAETFDFSWLLGHNKTHVGRPLAKTREITKRLALLLPYAIGP